MTEALSTYTFSVGDQVRFTDAYRQTFATNCKAVHIVGNIAPGHSNDQIITLEAARASGGESLIPSISSQWLEPVNIPTAST